MRRYFYSLLALVIFTLTAAAAPIKLQLSERFRLVTWDNAITLADTALGATTFTRHRTSLGGTWLARPGLELGLKLTNEFRYYFAPETREFTFDEVIVDNAYVKWTAPLDKPLTLTVGRQNLILGEGFLIMDGSPLDGSRSIYFNAARLDFTAGKYDLTAFFLAQQDRDSYLPPVNDRDLLLVEQPERGFGVYATRGFGSTTVEAYVIRKDADLVLAWPYDLRINVLGFRLKAPVAPGWEVVIENALQTGKSDAADRRAFGGHTYVTRRLDAGWFWPRTVKLGAIYLSGDDPATADKYEGWDPVFARWPKWSESYIYTQVRESRVADWSNQLSFYARLQYQCSQQVRFSFDYHHLRAFQASASGGFWGGGTTRGDLLIGKFYYQVNDRLISHLLWEWFQPGDFYFDGADSYSWVRAEFLYKLDCEI